MSNKGPLAVVGIGSPFRSDDIAGHLVIDLLNEKIGEKVVLKNVLGDPAELINIFSSFNSFYLIDACQNLDSWQRIDLSKESIEDESAKTSTHGFGLSDSINMAKNLNLLPNKLILYALNGYNYEVGDTVSEKTLISVESVVEAILKEEDIYKNA